MQAVLASAEIARVDFTSAQIFNVAKPQRAQHLIELDRIERGDEFLARFGDAPRKSVEHHALPERQQLTRDRIIENHGRWWRRRRDVLEGDNDRVHRQIRRDAEPGETRRTARVEAGSREDRRQRFLLKIDRDEDYIAGDSQTDLVKPRALPGLCRRVINFKYAKRACGIGITVREGVETGAEQDVLAYTSIDRARQLIFGATAPRREKRP